MKQRNLQISCIAKTDKGFCYQPLFCVVPLPHLRNNWSLITSNCFSVFNVCCSDAWPTLWILAYPDMLLLVKGIFWMYICTRFRTVPLFQSKPRWLRSSCPLFWWKNGEQNILVICSRLSYCAFLGCFPWLWEQTEPFIPVWKNCRKNLAEI